MSVITRKHKLLLSVQEEYKFFFWGSHFGSKLFHCFPCKPY